MTPPMVGGYFEHFKTCVSGQRKLGMAPYAKLTD